MLRRALIGYAVAASVAADGQPVQLVPMGRFEIRGELSSRGHYELRDRAHAEAVIAATRAAHGSSDILVDYDHQAEKIRIGGTAPASGWIEPASLEARDDGIWGVVRWTPVAAARIEAREYRYISPVFLPTRDRRVARLLRVGLVNEPAIEELAAIAASTGEDDQMEELAKVAAALGLPADTKADAIVASVTALKTSAGAVAVAAGLAADAKADDVVTAVAAARSSAGAGAYDPAKYVPIEQVMALQAELAAASGESVEKVVASAIEAGKLPPALKAWGTELATTNRTAFDAWLEKAPAVVAAGRTLPTAKAAEGDNVTSLTEEERKIIAMTGVSEADYLKQKGAR